jgi:amino acid transporter
MGVSADKDGVPPHEPQVASAGHRRSSWPTRVRERLIGRARDPLDPRVFHQISLVAFLAWVGLGADGLSSSCYGPEEAYRALGPHHFLALLLALLMALTVFVVSASYAQIIELFPSGGGGYLVATQLLGPGAGLVSGCALVVDYVLTIAISIASGVDAVFSLLPPEFQRFELIAAMAVVGVLIMMNLRGVKESVTVLVPIFLVFLATHALVIAVGLATHARGAPALVAASYQESQRAAGAIGYGGLFLLLMRAYTLGGGTYTGIEAVSNGLQILREPRVQTAKRTMLYMALSLAAVSSGVLVSYMLLGVTRVPHQTLNAVLIEQVSATWPGAHAFVLVTLVSEGALLFVAAQAGFLDGPRVLANMAIDSWVPHRFQQLSDRLVTKNGIVLMGGAALGMLIYTGGSVGILVVLYSINVFLTFSLSQLGMCVHWWRTGTVERRWRRRLAVNGLGLLMTASILVATLTLKFAAGGWFTVLLTSSFIGACVWIRRHYDSARDAVRRLDDILTMVPIEPVGVALSRPDSQAPTAVFLVSGYNGLGIHALLAVPRLFGRHFKNAVFVSVGVVDSSRFKGTAEIEHLRAATEEELGKYVRLARSAGVHAEYRYAIGTDAVDELVRLCEEVARAFPRSVFFAGKLIFAEESVLTRLLHNQAARTLQRRLQFKGLQMVVLPVRAM